MHATADVSIVPLGADQSLSPYIAACEKVLQEAGLQPRLHAFGTGVEGDWDEIMAALHRCHEQVHAMGAARILTTVKIATRSDRRPSLDEPVASVRARLESD